MTDAQDTERRLSGATRVPAWHIGILAMLMLAQVICAALSSTASTDTNRDIYFAQQIAFAREFPLLGPQINGMMHLGPVWFYVLAIAAWLIPNAAAVPAFIALIGSLQFPLAYRLGQRFGSAREGLLFALMLALPGFMAVSLVSLTHTIAVIPCLLLGVFAGLAYRDRPDGKRAFWMGVVAALALNAHPTTLFLVAMLIFWCAAKTGSPRRRLSHGAIVVVPIVLSFAPMFYAQGQDGLADMVTASNYLHEGLGFPSLSKGVFLIYAVLSYGPKYMARFWLDMPPVAARWLLVIYGAVLAAAIIGLAQRFLESAQRRKWISILLGLLVLQSMFVCAIRSDMPPWMVYAQWPLTAALLAIGLDRICATRSWPRIAIAIALIVTTSWSLAIWMHMAAGKLDFVEMKPVSGKLPLMADIREYSKDRLFFRMPRIPFREVFALGEPLCKPTTVFAHYAYFLDISYGIGAIRACGDRANIQLGGPSGQERVAWFGLRDRCWQQLGMEPARWIGVVGVSTPAAVWRSPVPLYPETPRFSTWPHHITATPTRFVIEGDAAPEQAVLIAHRANRYLPFSVIGATANGIEIKPVYEDLMTAIYRLPAGLSINSAHWRIEVEGASEYVDALTFASSR